jgi:hypothetical protein
MATKMKWYPSGLRKKDGREKSRSRKGFEGLITRALVMMMMIIMSERLLKAACNSSEDFD